MLRVTRMLPALFLAVPLQPIAAQAIGSLLQLEGEKVRVSVAIGTSDASGSVTIHGTVSAQRGDSIQVVENRGRVWNLPVSSIQRIDVSQGRDRRRGAGIGALVGVALGLLISTEPPSCNDRGYGIDCNPDGSTPSTARYVAGNVETGAILGAMIGAAIGVERWEPIMARPRLNVAPIAGGIGLRLSF